MLEKEYSGLGLYQSARPKRNKLEGALREVDRGLLQTDIVRSTPL